jgi:hypothetical protein
MKMGPTCSKNNIGFQDCAILEGDNNTEGIPPQKSTQIRKRLDSLMFDTSSNLLVSNNKNKTLIEPQITPETDFNARFPKLSKTLENF